MNKVLDAVRPLAFWGAFVLAFIALAEGVAERLAFSLVAGIYSAGRLLEFAAIVMIFAIGLLLRDILTELRRARN